MKPNIDPQDLSEISDTPKSIHGLENDTYNTTNDDGCRHIGEVAKLLKTLQFSLALFGMFHYTSKNIDRKPEEARTRLIPSKAAIYNLIVLLGTWGYFVKGIVALFVADIDSDYAMLKFVPIAWGLQMAVNVLMLLKLSHPRFGNMTGVHELLFNKVAHLTAALKLTPQQRNVKRHVLIVLILGWIGVASNISLSAFCVFYPNTRISYLMASLVIAPLPNNIFTKIFMSIAMVYISTATIMTMVYVIIVCILTKLCFNICVQAVQEANKSVTEPGVYPGCLHSQRQLHLYTCQAVEYFDKDIKYLFANVFFTTVPIACLTLYQMFQVEMDVLSTAVHVIWVAYFLMTMTIMCAYAASMNNAAHAPLRCLYKTGMKGINMEQIGEMNLFMSQLTANPIGFTILDFFVITREFVLTVGGLFLTYSFVLLQF